MDLVELSSIEAKGEEYGLKGKRNSTIVGVTDRSSKYYDTEENVYQEIPDVTGEMYECMDGQVTANPLAKADEGDDLKCTATSQTSGINAVDDDYERMGEDDSVTANPLAKVDISDESRGSGLYL